MEGKKDRHSSHGAPRLVRKANFKQENTRVVRLRKVSRMPWLHKAWGLDLVKRVRESLSHKSAITLIGSFVWVCVLCISCCIAIFLKFNSWKQQIFFLFHSYHRSEIHEQFSHLVLVGFCHEAAIKGLSSLPQLGKGLLECNSLTWTSPQSCLAR